MRCALCFLTLLALAFQIEKRGRLPISADSRSYIRLRGGRNREASPFFHSAATRNLRRRRKQASTQKRILFGLLC
jgi:hypothetical protein